MARCLIVTYGVAPLIYNVAKIMLSLLGGDCRLRGGIVYINTSEVCLVVLVFSGRYVFAWRDFISVAKCGSAWLLMLRGLAWFRLVFSELTPLFIALESTILNVKFAIEAQVIKTLCDCFEVGRRKIECSSLLVEDLNVDSMSIVEIVMALNAVFDVELSAVEVSDWRAVADICRSVESAKASAALT